MAEVTRQQRRDRVSDAFAGVAHEAEVLVTRLVQMSSRVQFVHPADRAAMDAAVAGVSAAARQCRYLSVRAKGQ